MHRPLLLAVALGCACAPVAAPPASPSPVVTTLAGVTPRPTSPLTFAVGAEQARYVATVVQFVDAFNAGAVDTALALLADNVVGGDCDYGRRALITFQNRRDAEAWLRGRAADHDRLEIAHVVNENPDPATGSRVVAVGWLARKSDLLRAAIVPTGAAKVVFTPDGLRIVAFNNGPLDCTR